MTTIKLAVLKHTRAKDGSYKIRISIGHKSETHYIVTKYRVTSLSHFQSGQVVGQPDANHINLKLRQILNDYDERLERIPNPGDYTCEQLRDILQNMQTKTTDVTFRTVSDQFTSQLRDEGRASYAKMLHRQTLQFLDYCKGDVFLSEISPRLIDGYSRWVKSKGVSPAYESICLVSVRTIINRAVKMQQVRYDVHPFTYWKETKAEPRDLDISVEDMRKIFASHSPYKGMRRAADFFKLSYILGGVNMIDLLQYDFRDYKRDCCFQYIRFKTRNKKSSNRTTSITIQPEAFPIIDRYMDPKTGLLVTGSKGSYLNFLTTVNRALKNLATHLDLDCKRITFYSARKSFVQHGFDLGISLEVLEYCIGQSVKANRPIFNYLKIMRRHADVAVRTILDNLSTSITTQQTDENATEQKE